MPDAGELEVRSGGTSAEALAKGVAPNGAAPYVPGRAARAAGGAVERVMPTDFSIAFEVGNGAWKPGVERGPRRQSMRGFEDTYVDIVDYIVRITHRIWEDQDIGYIYDTYSPSCRVYDDGGPRHGIEQMVDGHDPTDQRLPRHAPLRRRGDLGGQRRAGLRHVAPGPQHRPPHRALALGPADGPQGQHAGSSPTASSATTRSSRSGCSTTSPPSSPSSASTSPPRRVPTATRAPCARSPSASSPRSSGSRAARSPSRYPAPRGDGFDVDHFVRALLHDTYNRRDLSADRPCLRPERALVRHDEPQRLRAQRRQGDGAQPAVDVPRPRPARRRGVLDGQRARRLPRARCAGRHSARTAAGRCTASRPAAACTSGRCSSCTSRAVAIVEDWMLFNEFDVLAQLLKDDPEPLDCVPRPRRPLMTARSLALARSHR